jgi:hypothetical protein
MPVQRGVPNISEVVKRANLLHDGCIQRSAHPIERVASVARGPSLSGYRTDRAYTFCNTLISTNISSRTGAMSQSVRKVRASAIAEATG